MAEESKSVKTMNNSRIEVVKFNGTNNFGMWRCEVMDALNAQNLEDTLLLEKKKDTTTDDEWAKMNRSACGLIRSCLSQDIKYSVQHEKSAKDMWNTLEKKYLTKSVESRLQLKSKLYLFRMQRGSTVNEHLNRFTKLLTDLLNVDAIISEEDKSVILLNSLPPEEYEIFTMTFLNGKQTLDYDEISSALMSYEKRKNEKHSGRSSSSAEALEVRGRSSSRKGKEVRGRSKSRPGLRDLKKDQCMYCKEFGH